MRRTLTVIPLLFLPVLALPAAAEVYTVALKNGGEVITAYQPQEASFDKNMVLLLTEVGNWIGVRKADIESVRSEAEIGGYGRVLSKNTILLGWSANDAANPDDEQAQGGKRNETDTATAQALKDIYNQRQAEQNYTIKQFVRPEDTQGIPARLIGPSPATPAPPQ